MLLTKKQLKYYIPLFRFFCGIIIITDLLRDFRTTNPQQIELAVSGVQQKPGVFSSEQSIRMLPPQKWIFGKRCLRS